MKKKIKLLYFCSRTNLIRAWPPMRTWRTWTATISGKNCKNIKIRMKSPPRRALKIPCGDNGRAPTLTRRTPTLTRRTPTLIRSQTWSKILTLFDAMTEWKISSNFHAKDTLLLLDTFSWIQIEIIFKTQCPNKLACWRMTISFVLFTNQSAYWNLVERFSTCSLIFRCICGSHLKPSISRLRIS